MSSWYHINCYELRLYYYLQVPDVSYFDVKSCLFSLNIILKDSLKITLCTLLRATQSRNLSSGPRRKSTSRWLNLTCFYRQHKSDTLTTMSSCHNKPTLTSKIPRLDYTAAMSVSDLENKNRAEKEKKNLNELPHSLTVSCFSGAPRESSLSKWNDPEAAVSTSHTLVPEVVASNSIPIWIGLGVKNTFQIFETRFWRP